MVITVRVHCYRLDIVILIYLSTGDIAYYDNDGYFFIVDRIKELIKCKGLQVFEHYLLEGKGLKWLLYSV